MKNEQHNCGKECETRQITWTDNYSRPDRQ